MHRSEEFIAAPEIQGHNKLAENRSSDLNSSGIILGLAHANVEFISRSSQLYREGSSGSSRVDAMGNAEQEFGVECELDHALKEDCWSGLERTNLIESNRYGLMTTTDGTGKIDTSNVEQASKLVQEEACTCSKRRLLTTTSVYARSMAGGSTTKLSTTSGRNHHLTDGSSSVSSKSDERCAINESGWNYGSGAKRALKRTQSTPTSSFSRVRDARPGPNTDGSRQGCNQENHNSHLFASEKMSDRKKKKLIKRLAPVSTKGYVEFDEAGSKRIKSFLSSAGLSIYDEGGEIGEEDFNEEDATRKEVPPLQVVMLIVGTRGDVQPFVAIGKHLQGYGHRVRLATHSNFREFVLTAGLEFYPLGGDPKVLAGYMVKNKGFLPSLPSEVSVQRKQIKSIIHSLLPACTAADPEAGSGLPFRAQAIIANPPAYGHVHVAEYLQVPLHIFFTMPWTATSEFPHPLSRVKSPAGYRVVDSLIWWGIRSMINDFRKKKLKLRPITYLSGSQGSISELPTGYIWSPHLVPKPRDWGPMVDVVGFCFLNLVQDYKPPHDLVEWLAAGPPPVYVGFGSLPVVDPKGMTKIIIKALRETKQRGIIYKGWGGIGDMKEIGSDIFLIEDCPHDWLFKHCLAVVHHGGAGTTAAGLKAGCPTTIVPFFGDQPFWGERIHEKGVGPAPIPVDQFSYDKLVKAILFMLHDEVKQRAVDIARAMEKEDGVDGAVKAFHKHLPRNTLQPLVHHPPQRLRHRVLKPLRSVYNCFI